MYSAMMSTEEELRGKNRLPVTDRSPTDVFCCFAFGIFVIVFGLVAIAALCYGDPRQIVYPTDSAGRLCGVKTKTYDFRNKSHLVFLDLILCFEELSTNKTQCPTPQICVDQCPRKYFAVGPESQYDQPGILRLINDTICISEKVKSGLKDYQGLNRAILDGKCASYYLPSSPMLGRCLPDVLLNGWTNESIDKVRDMVVESKKNLFDALRSHNATGFASGLSTMTTRFLERIGADLKASWWQILLGLLLTIVLGLAWIYIMRFIAAYMVWASIVLSLVLLWGGAIFCWTNFVLYVTRRNEDLNVKSGANPGMFVAMAMIFSFFGIVYLCVICCFFSRIRMAIVLIKEASKAVGDISCSLFFPVIPGLIDLIMLIVWGVVLIHLFSTGQPICRYNDRTPPGHQDPSGNLVKNSSDCSCSTNTTDVDPYCQFWSYSLSQLAMVGFAFCVFAVLWFGFFISAFNQMVLGGAFGFWYWTFRKPLDLPRNAVFQSLSNTVRYHLGSVAFGSFLIATIRFIRYLLDIAESSAKKNFVFHIIVAIVKCICSCIEDLMRYLNKNAYIMVSVHGTSFYTSAKNAFNLLLKNIDRVIVLNQVTSAVLFASQLVIILVSVGIAYAFGTSSLTQNLNYGWLPLVCIFIGSVIICNIFFEVFDMAVDTIFLCFVEDLDSNDGMPHYMSNELKDLLLKDSSQTV